MTSGSGTLYIVATPIGNLGDISSRALEILASVDLIAAEDTRRTRKLLTRFGIKCGMVAYFRGREASRGAGIIARLEAGEDVALVSDAGTPGISDPGWFLVDRALAAGIRVVPVPGPCALAAMVSVAGFPGPEFFFLGFPPTRKKARADLFSSCCALPCELVFYESPRRILATLADIAAIMGDRRVAVGRELTKLNEEVIRAPVREAMAMLAARPAVKGELVVVVERAPARPRPEREDIVRRLEELRETGTTMKDAVAAIRKETGAPRREIYTEALSVWGEADN